MNGAIPSLRSWIWRLACAGLLGATLTAMAAGWLSWRDQEARLGLNLQATAGAIGSAVDREIDEAIALGRGLAASRALARGDLDGFETEARTALLGYGYAIVLIAADSGHQVVHTHYPQGAAVPPISPGTDWLDAQLRRGEIVLKPLRQSRATKEWGVVVQVPVRGEKGELLYAVNVFLPSTLFQSVLDEQRLPPQWTAVIIDHGGKIAARRPSPELYVGAAPRLHPEWDSMRADALYRSITLEGFEIVFARWLSPRYGMAAAVGMPTASLPAQFLIPVVLAGLGGFAVTGLSLLAISFMAARLLRAIAGLATATEALGKGDTVSLPDLPVRELARVGEALQRAALSVRDNQRHLEERIAEATENLRREATERQKAEIALAQSQKVEAMGQLTGGIAHDFNNLLGAVVGNLDLLRRRAVLDDRTTRYIENAMIAAERGTKLTSQLLVFSRSQRLDLKPVIIADLIEGMREMLARTLGPQIRITLRLETGRVAVLSEPTQLELAILNLAINARDSMSEGGELAIAASTMHADNDPQLQPGAYVRLSVSDSGTGMTPETAARAFEPFFTTKGVGKGTGLGLSQVFGIASRGGGTARIDTRRGGTTVHLFLRQAEAVPASAEAVASAAPLQNLPALRVLIVDDDPAIRELLRSFLDEHGLESRESEDGQSALDEIERFTPDLVLLDYAMPGLSGAQVATAAKARHPDLQIIFVTGYADSDAIEQAVGPDALLLRKPFRLSDLDAIIARAIGLCQGPNRRESA